MCLTITPVFSVICVKMLRDCGEDIKLVYCNLTFCVLL